MLGGLRPGTYAWQFEREACTEFWQDEESLDTATQIVVSGSGVATIAAQLVSDDAGCPDVLLPGVNRLAGSDRCETAIAISQDTFWDGEAGVVYLTSGQNYPDGLAAGPAAAHEGGPVLLTPQRDIPNSVLDEIERLDPEKVVIVGAEQSVSSLVMTRVQQLDDSRTAVRLGGADRFETSRLVADHAFDRSVAAFVATGFKFPDALAAGPAAALLDGPVILVNGGSADLDAATRATLRDLDASWIGAVGDEQSISAGVGSGLRGFDQVSRFAGRDRFATAAALGSLFPTAWSAYVASGEGFADALPGAAAAGAIGAPMVLAELLHARGVEDDARDLGAELGDGPGWRADARRWHGLVHHLLRPCRGGAERHRPDRVRGAPR